MQYFSRVNMTLKDSSHFRAIDACCNMLSLLMLKEAFRDDGEVRCKMQIVEIVSTLVYENLVTCGVSTGI